MFEGDHRRERRDVGRPPQHFGAVHRVAFHDRELGVGELVRLVEHLERCLDFPEVVHQRGHPELAEQRPVDPQPARLAHRQDRHVHHVRERVIVVALERRQRHERRPVLSHRLREAVDHRLGGRGVGLPFGFCALPHEARDRHGIVIHAANRRRVGEAFFDALLDLNPAKTDVREDRQLGRPVFTDPSRFDRGQRLYQAGDFFFRHAPIDGHALDAGELHALHELAEQFDLPDRHVAHDDLSADDAYRDRRLRGVNVSDARHERVDVSGDDWVARRVELRRSQR